jgi:hypothetical protein
MWIFPKISTDPIVHRQDLSLNNMTTARRQIVPLPVFSPSRIEDSREPIVRIDLQRNCKPIDTFGRKPSRRGEGWQPDSCASPLQ